MQAGPRGSRWCRAPITGEARWLAGHVALARGWERQLDEGRNGIFYDERPLTAARYRSWLTEQAISYVALPDAPLDYSAESEARLLLGGRGRGRRPIRRLTCEKCGARRTGGCSRCWGRRRSWRRRRG